ncbi:transcriptional regulator [Amylibacter ulvae]|uniref:Transcriptional regulator n=1 Tax=Paramylibacter ulvae TaxID=1651968 RepID=A0ABQ3CZR3_9RHOB|nr:GntR family transcriptional regulator [Amylibacter ulvae]GHA43813.1 transcriptional regulator [Amylibacter ulvae]
MQPIEQPKSLMEVTTGKIRDAIVSGELSLGSKLSEQRLADMLGISRSPVRDALAALQIEGLVNVSPKRGSFVFTPDMRDVDELCEHRTILEIAAIRMGMDRNYDKLIKSLEESCDAMQRALDKPNPKNYSIADDQFHKFILDASGNRSIIKSYNHTISRAKALRTHLFTIFDENTDRSMGEHIQILEACRNKDSDLATTLIAKHIEHLATAFRIGHSNQPTDTST